MADMKGKVVLVTGAGGAIGKPMCVELARRGAMVVMAGRGKRIHAAAADVRAAVPEGEIDTLEIDLASLGSVRVAAADFDKRFPTLHVLINNAAVFSAERKLTADGHELLFGTNHLGHFLLTQLLLSK